ncbi:MAG: class I SAM-dependent methyltransferase [Candidatus Eremiobacterota bacterium]
MRTWLPDWLFAQLFGDRRRHGLRARKDDGDWERWLERFPEIYTASHNPGTLEAWVNRQGYRVLGDLDCSGKMVAEVGPGAGYHLDFLRGAPSRYTALDVAADFFPILEQRLSARGTRFVGHHLQHFEPQLPLETHSQDILLSFYSLEHLYPLPEWLDELHRVVRPGGLLVGAIPAEGGLAWGAGRWLTSRRTFRNRWGLDLLKLICWSHVNMCDEIMARLRRWGPCSEDRWPFSWLPYDLNLLIRFRVVRGVSTIRA